MRPDRLITGISDFNKTVLCSIVARFDECLEIWEQEGRYQGEDRTEAVRVLQSRYKGYRVELPCNFCLDLSSPEFNNISSFSSLSLESYFPYATKIDFSNCAALLELPEAFPGDICEIVVAGCTALQIDLACIPSHLKVSGCAYTQFTQFIAKQWEENASALFNYADKFSTLAKCGLAKVNLESQFFFFSYPGHLVDDGYSEDSLGWKAHVSVDPIWVNESFEIVIAIVSKYNLRCKVINTLGEVQPSERFLTGAQITIYLEQKQAPAISADKLKEMGASINEALLAKNISPGIRPESDAKIVGSNFCSLRNDKCTVLSRGSRLVYLSADEIGNDFNPDNNPNPFAMLLDPEVKRLTPIDLFNNAYDGSISSEALFVVMLNQCIGEFMCGFDERDEFGNISLGIKEEYANRAGIEEAMSLALEILNEFNFDERLLDYEGHGVIMFADYSVDNGFKKMLLDQKVRSREVIDMSHISY